jgi:hypothetical protein
MDFHNRSNESYDSMETKITSDSSVQFLSNDYLASYMLHYLEIIDRRFSIYYIKGSNFFKME